MYRLYMCLIFSILSFSFANPLTYDVDDSSINTAFVDPTLDSSYPSSLLLQGDFVEAINPCTADADAEEAIKDTLMKRDDRACPSRWMQYDLMPEQLKSDLRKYQILVGKRESKATTPSHYQTPDETKPNDPGIASTNANAPCADHEQRQEHVTCGGPEYGYYSPNWILWVIDCVTGFRMFIRFTLTVRLSVIFVLPLTHYIRNGSRYAHG